MNTKAIYQPQGKAREYSRWACNFYVGCSNGCSYCYNKRGVLGSVAGGDRARLKSCFKDENDAFARFLDELSRFRDAIIRDGGLFFSFTTDPCLPETLDLTLMAVAAATGMGVPCTILTKRADWILEDPSWYDSLRLANKVDGLLTIGFTLTGCDDLEKKASTNIERIYALERLYDAGVRTFVSVEPVVDFYRAICVIGSSLPWCDHYKIGLVSGDAHAYDRYRMPDELEDFVRKVRLMIDGAESVRPGRTVYWKKSVIDALGHDIPAGPIER